MHLVRVRGSSRRIPALAAIMTLGVMPGVTRAQTTATPIKHVVVIFQENVSFDHYFATYPHAANNSSSEPVFRTLRDFLLPKPSVNGLTAGLFLWGGQGSGDGLL